MNPFLFGLNPHNIAPQHGDAFFDNQNNYWDKPRNLPGFVDAIAQRTGTGGYGPQPHPMWVNHYQDPWDVGIGSPIDYGFLIGHRFDGNNSLFE